MSPQDESSRITLIGAGTIGLSFAALHIRHLMSPKQLSIYDTRPDLEAHVHGNLSKFLPLEKQGLISEIRLFSSPADLSEAISNATIVQEQGPENAAFKAQIWAEIEKHAREDALFWSSTSGIPASVQSAQMSNRGRLVVVHPYNPPHIMPLLEVVPSPHTSEEVISRTMDFWRSRGRQPVVIHKECTGFVANRLAFALLREAISIVDQGIVSVAELDRIVESSMGPRWAVAGPFKSYHAGGGDGGLEAFFANIGATIQQCWDDTVRVQVGDSWEQKVFPQANETYGTVDLNERDRITAHVLEATGKTK